MHTRAKAVLESKRTSIYRQAREQNELQRAGRTLRIELPEKCVRAAPGYICRVPI